MNIPEFSLLSEKEIIGIIDEAMDVLEQIGFFVENDEALTLLADYGMQINKKTRKAYCSKYKIEEILSQPPKSIAFYDREGVHSFTLKNDVLVFTPGSAALNILDYESMKIRSPQTHDAKIFHFLLQELDYIKAQSTALIYNDVPGEIQDSYRLYLALLYCSKPVVTGTFRKESFSLMKDLLLAVRGSEKNLREKPLAVFDACPSSPLKWSTLTAQSLIDCARNGIPSELVSMPIAGATSPATLKDVLVQHTAETFSGILISQAASLGAPVIYGGSPSILDMRFGTTPMGAIETMIIDCCFARIGKYFGLPTHAYMGLSDSKQIDYQAGLESGIGIILAALSGINMVAGAGMLNFESCQSLEKLLLDNEICGMAYRLKNGINLHKKKSVAVLLERLISNENFLCDSHTLKWFREEFLFPGNTIDRSTLKVDKIKAMTSSADLAHRRITKIMELNKKASISDCSQQLYKIMSKESKKFEFQIKMNN